jgi:hypothetical protein
MSDEPQEPARRRGVPLWLFIVSMLGAVIFTGSTVWTMRVNMAGSVPAAAPTVSPTATVSVPTTPVASAVPTPSTPLTSAAPATPTAPATATAAATVTTPPPPPPRPAAGQQPARVTHMAWSSSKGYRITTDYVQILTGEAAANAAAAAAGEESPPPSDYFILNDSAKLRTFALAKTASITVLGWGGAGATVKHRISVGQFFDVMPGGANTQEPWSKTYYYLTVKSGTVTRVEQIYLP